MRRTEAEIGMDRDTHSIVDLPKPRPAKTGHGKLTVVTVLAVALVGGAVFWLTRDEETRQVVKQRVATSTEHLRTTVEDSVRGTPLEGVMRLLTPPPPPLPASVTSPPTQPGTLAGQVIQSAVPTPAEPGAEGEIDPDAVPIAAKVEEDSVVRPQFVDDLAAWMVSRYQPGKGGGSSGVGVQSANLRYGGALKGFGISGDIPAGREALLRYAFTPTMLEALYELYADRFVEHLGTAAATPQQGKMLTPSQIDDMYRLYAARLALLAGVLDGVAAVPDLSQKLEAMEKSAQRALDIHTRVTEAVFTLDQARENGSRTRIEAAQLRVDGLNAQYQRAINERTVAQQALTSAVRSRGAVREADDDTILFVAGWAGRRQAKHPHTQATLRKGAQLLRDLSGRLQRAGSVAR
ncbi:MAG: hypothetical protein K2O70_05740 [Desulfovibrionaceae bacterium]|nr:hypothetical protein [Desulfovibrionaceae bacterium]